jgi:hypothetical protein
MGRTGEVPNMPRKKTIHIASLRHPFLDGDSLLRTVGEVMANQIEQAAQLLDLAQKNGDVESIKAAKAIRARVIAQIDEWAGKAINRQIKGPKGPATRLRDQKRGGHPLKKDLALIEIQRLIKAGKEPRSIPGIVAEKKVCSARYARDLMAEIYKE